MRRVPSWWQNLCLFLGCAAAPFVPWLIRIAKLSEFFVAQMTAQSIRKSLYLGYVLTTYGYKRWLMSPFVNATGPLGYRGFGSWPFPIGSSSAIPLLVFCVGLAGLVMARKHSVDLSLLGAWAIAGYAFNLFVPEYWYTIYYLTPSCLLLGWTLAESSRSWMRGIALFTLIVAGAWNYSESKLIWQYSRDGWQAYQSYCLSLVRAVPPRSTILIAAIPDPYFGLLRQNESYRIYEFVPTGIPVDEVQADKILDKVDYVIGSDCCRPGYLVNYLTAHGQIETVLGQRDFLSPPVVLWKLRPTNRR